MTNDDILALAKQGKPDTQSAKEFLFCTQEGLYGIKADIEQACDVMRRCMKVGGMFRWAFYDGESDDKETAHEPFIGCYVEEKK